MVEEEEVGEELKVKRWGKRWRGGGGRKTWRMKQWV